MNTYEASGLKAGQTYEVWMERYLLNGMDETVGPTLLGTTVAESFGDACLAVCRKVKWPSYSNVPFENMFQPAGTHSPPKYWGCRLYRSREEASNDGLQASTAQAHSGYRYAV